jgi:hypothetical protein
MLSNFQYSASGQAFHESQLSHLLCTPYRLHSEDVELKTSQADRAIEDPNIFLIE